MVNLKAVELLLETRNVSRLSEMQAGTLFLFTVAHAADWWKNGPAEDALQKALHMKTWSEVNTRVVCVEDCRPAPDLSQNGSTWSSVGIGNLIGVPLTLEEWQLLKTTGKLTNEPVIEPAPPTPLKGKRARSRALKRSEIAQLSFSEQCNLLSTLYYEEDERFSFEQKTENIAVVLGELVYSATCTAI